MLKHLQHYLQHLVVLNKNWIQHYYPLSYTYIINTIWHGMTNPNKKRQKIYNFSIIFSLPKSHRPKLKHGNPCRSHHHHHRLTPLDLCWSWPDLAQDCYVLAAASGDLDDATRPNWWSICVVAAASYVRNPLRGWLYDTPNHVPFFSPTPPSSRRIWPLPHQHHYHRRRPSIG